MPRRESSLRKKNVIGSCCHVWFTQLYPHIIRVNGMVYHGLPLNIQGRKSHHLHVGKIIPIHIIHGVANLMASHHLPRFIAIFRGISYGIPPSFFNQCGRPPPSDRGT